MTGALVPPGVTIFPETVGSLQDSPLNCQGLNCQAEQDGKAAIGEIPELLGRLDTVLLDLKIHRRLNEPFIYSGHRTHDPIVEYLSRKAAGLETRLRGAGDLLITEILAERPDAVRIFLSEAARSRSGRERELNARDPFLSADAVMKLGPADLARELRKVIAAVDGDKAGFPGGYPAILREIVSLALSLGGIENG